jgi:hypothetical protein
MLRRLVPTQAEISPLFFPAAGLVMHREKTAIAARLIFRGSAAEEHRRKTEAGMIMCRSGKNGTIDLASD